MEDKEYHYESVAYVNEDTAGRMVEFLKYSGIEESKSEYDKYSESYNVLVDSKNFRKADNLIHVFLENEPIEHESENEDLSSSELLSEAENADSDDIDSNNDTRNSNSKSDLTLYESIDDKYKDNLSSAYTFLICGAAGLIILLLNYFDIIHLMELNLMFHLFVGGLFLLFIGIGIHSLKYSGKLKEEVKKHRVLTDKIITTLHNELSKDTIEAACDNSMPEEIKYYNRIEIIKDRIKMLDDSLSDETLTNISEEFYTEVFNQ